mmetsp:Transcript_60260/g.142617  ORF Transcript_60260/g.142617 Transcript_60260/m.142617 type:complete len:85 (+) Transcript_60260:326-580(+)
MLIGMGAHVNATGSVGWTPLHYSARGGHVEVSLVGAGANVHATDIYNSTAINIARLGGHSALAELLQESETLTKSAAQCGGGDK